MTKEQYLDIISRSQIPMNIWFEYYRERGGLVDDFAQFERLFSTALVNEFTVESSSIPKKISLTSALHNFYSYYNKKFGMDEYKRPTPEGGSSFIFI